MKQVDNDSSNKGSNQIWLNAAYESLLESGIESVKIQLLAKKLNLSRASFYWFYKDREELLDALLEQWSKKNTDNFIQRTTAFADNQTEAILNVCDCWFDENLFDSKLEFAIRSWALQSKNTLIEVQNADQVRIEALTKMFKRVGLTESQADVKARMIYLVQIGYIAMQSKEEMAERISRIPEYLKIYTGEYPAQSEINRFLSRHNLL